MGLKIFLLSMRRVFDNLAVAFRISLVLYLIYAGVSIWAGQGVGSEFASLSGEQMPSAGSMFSALISAIVTVVLFSWIAVAWHRFVLLGEVPTSFVPAWRGRSVLQYIITSIIIGVLLMLLSLLVGFGLGLFLVPLGGTLGTLLLWSVMVVVVAIVAYRLSVVLPSVAIGDKIAISEALEVTKGAGGTLFFLGLVAGVASIIIELPAMFSPDPASLLNQIYLLVIGWFTLMIGVSILTTLYDVFVEGNTPD